MDPSKVAVGDVLLLPLIIGLVQAIKRFFPVAQNTVWFGLAFVFGVAGQVVVFLIAHPGSTSKAGNMPWAGWDFATWALCIVTGLAFGLAAGKTYDVAKDGI